MLLKGYFVPRTFGDGRCRELSRDEMLQRRAVQKLHGKERLPVHFANVVNRANVGVIQGMQPALRAGNGRVPGGRSPALPRANQY